MKLAIEAMKRAVDELNKDAPSQVGAVLASLMTYETAYRVNTDGDHSEYTCWIRNSEPKICQIAGFLPPQTLALRPEARRKPAVQKELGMPVLKVWYGVQEPKFKAKGGKKLLEENTKPEVLPFDLDLAIGNTIF